MPSLPKLSIAAKLYAIFALLATVTVGMASLAVIDARHEVELMREFNTGFLGARYVERVNGLIYAVVMESRGIYMSPDIATAKPFAANLLKFNDRIGTVVKDWRQVVRADDAEQFAAFAQRIAQFREFRRELVRRGTEINPQAGREYGDNDANRSVRSALNKDLEALAAIYAKRSERIYSRLAADCSTTAWVMTALGLAMVLLAGFGMLLISRAVARPLRRITRVTAAVAAGDHGRDIPYGDRRDEIGALARSIRVFEQAMRRNDDLKQTIVADAEARAQRQEAIGGEVRRFGAEVEATLAELARISAEMLTASGALSAAADHAASRTAGATTASGEAYTNVRDIASAAEELSASVNEIDRQVTQSNAIAARAVTDAERTNAAVKELGEAAARIGDVVRLITAIAEQTNLLALNATIEAARAGEAGRGFAVVAGEVKALAGQTAKATDQIGAQIAGMQQATTRSIEAIGGIARTIREIGAISSTIAAAVTEQGAATQEIARSVETAAKRTAETADEVGRVTGATSATRTSAASVKTVADDLEAVAARIRGQIDQFFSRLNAA